MLYPVSKPHPEPSLARTWREEKVKYFTPPSNILLSPSPQSFQGVRLISPNSNSQSPIQYP